MIDKLIQGTLAVLFSVFAAAIAFGIGSTLFGPATLTGLQYAQFASKTCLLLFLAMMAYLTFAAQSPVARAGGWQPRISALLGTNLTLVGFLFLGPRTDLSVSQNLLSAGLILAGNGLSVYVLSHLGRSFSIMAEARKLVANGPYGVVRHPLYLAEEVAIVGVFIQFASVPAAILILVHFAFQLRRMLNEEKLLSDTFPEYTTYMTRTARLVPGVW